MNARNPQELSTVLEISQTLSSALDLRTALIRLLEILEEQRGTVSGAITLLDDESGELNIEAATGMTWQVRRRAKYKVGEGVTGRVVESGRPVIVPRVSHEPLFLDRTKVWKESEHDELSFVCVPVGQHPYPDKPSGELQVRRYQNAVRLIRGTTHASSSLSSFSDLHSSRSDRFAGSGR